MILFQSTFYHQWPSLSQYLWREGTFGAALEFQFGACGCSWGVTAIVPLCQGSAHLGLGIHQIPFCLKAIPWETVSETNSGLFFINLWSVYILICAAERSMCYKEGSTNCRSESSVLGWQGKVLLSECFKRIDFHFCKSWCFKNLCQTIQSTKNYSLEEKSEYCDVSKCFTILNFPLKWLFFVPLDIWSGVVQIAFNQNQDMGGNLIALSYCLNSQTS